MSTTPDENVATTETANRDLDAGALKALSHPMRLEIYDVLSQFGRQTASSLAERIGESSGATSYHLRMLAKHDLIREVDGLGTGRERWWERPRGSVSIGSPTARKTAAGKLASDIVVEEFYRRRHDQLIHYLRSLGEARDIETSLLTTSVLPLSADQFVELAAEISETIGRFHTKYASQSGPGVQRYAVRADIFPITQPETSEA